MSIPIYKIFISSVQKEMAEDRAAIKTFILKDPLLHRFFTPFLFEDLPATDQRADKVYLSEVDNCGIYIGLFGNDYGFDSTDLTSSIFSSLVDFLASCGIIQTKTFENRPCLDAILDHVDQQAVTSFLKLARAERQFPLEENSPVQDVLMHLHLLSDDKPTNAAILLFGLDPQRFLPNSEVRCMHFHATEIERPVPFYRIFKGHLLYQVDMAADFVLSKLNRSVGTRNESAKAPVSYEIPPEVIREAVVNAIAHRDYTSSGVVQVSVFADRVEIWNPGDLPSPLTVESLRHPHSSIARNQYLCDALHLVHYIEKYGTGTLMMIKQCLAQGLPEPDFVQRGGEFSVTLWRDWLTPQVLNNYSLTARQQMAIVYLKNSGSITNSLYQTETRSSKRTASRELDEMVEKGLIERIGTTGMGVHYRLIKRATKGPKAPKNQKK